MNKEKNRRRAARHQTRTPTSLVCVDLAAPASVKRVVLGFAVDVSEDGMKLLLPKTRAEKLDWFRAGLTLKIKLASVVGYVALEAAIAHSSEDDAAGCFMLGVFIKSMSDFDRDLFRAFLQTLSGSGMRV